MQILAFETSCDETGIALVEGRKTKQGLKFTAHKAALLSQAALHAAYGGVYPTLAKREHEKNLPILYKEFEREAADAVAVTAGPGLEPALWQGITFAQKVAAQRKVPLFAVNHMEGHLISSLTRLENNKSQNPNNKQIYKSQNIRLPVLGLLVSGGHTEFVLMREWFAYQIIGETLDDAVGEAFDKVARMLELPYPGGPEISRLATEARSKSQISNIKLPRPMLKSGTCDVSFSGLKTAALYALRYLEKSRSDLNTGLPKVGSLTHEEKAAFAAEFEDAVADVFVAKTRRALQETGAQTFVIGGGVAANRYLRERLQALALEEFPYVDLHLPELAITGDNAVMIAQAALAHLLMDDWRLDDASRSNLDIKAVGNLSLASK